VFSPGPSRLWPSNRRDADALTEDFRKLEGDEYIRYRKNQFSFEVLVNDKAAIRKKYPEAVVDGVTIEEIMLFYVRGGK